MRILLGVGGYSEAADDSTTPGSTTVAIRIKYEGQGDDLTRRFPGVSAGNLLVGAMKVLNGFEPQTYISAITEPKSVSIVGPAETLARVYDYARAEGLFAQKMDIRGKVHNPENQDLAEELCDVCEQNECLQLPRASALQVPVRSNISGLPLSKGSLTTEVVFTVLTSKCDWYTLLIQVAEDMKGSGRASHNIIYFGLNDCVPMSPFIKQHVQTTKTQAQSLLLSQSTRGECSQDFSMFPKSAIAVIGASCRLPGANNIEELWDLLSKGTDCHQELPTDRFDLHGSFRGSQSGPFVNDRKFYGNFLDDISRFDNQFFGINDREATNMDPQQRLLLELSHEALEASGYLASHRRDLGDSVGCFIGASLVEYLDNTNAHSPVAYTSTGTIRAFLCGRLSFYYGWRGPSEVIDTACSSSLVAINRACKAIQSKECRMALAGGVNAITGFNNFLDLSKAGFLSRSGQCKPFDASADGYCRSDGAGLVVLKGLEQAMNEGDPILGVIPGIATNQGGLSASITVPDSTAQRALYQEVLQQANLQPDNITYVEAHGTGTQAGDPVEMESIRSIFGDKSRSKMVEIGSIKGNIGHCETAAGVASLLKILAMLKHAALPPQANHQRLNPKIPPLEPDGMRIGSQLSPWKNPLLAAFVNSYGAAGSNCALLCCEVPVQKNRVPREHSDRRGAIPYPIIISASSKPSLLAYVQTLSAYLHQEGSSLSIRDLAFTLDERRRRMKFCITTVASDPTNLARNLENFGAPSFEYLPISKKPVVLVFSGQNDNKVTLSRSMYENYPAFRSHIDACDFEVSQLGYGSILPAIFQTQPIEDVVTLQSGIFAVQYACARCWIDSGLSVDTVIGHSLGELVALAISGTLCLEDALKLVTFRAHLIATKWGQEKGAMIAVHACTEDFERLFSRLQSQIEGPMLEIACYNASDSLVIVGASEPIGAFHNLLQADEKFPNSRFQRLHTSHGFHSFMTKPILADLDRMSQNLRWNDPQIPVETCTRECLGPLRGPYIAKHAREPVFFATAVERIEERLGSCLWLEAGIDTPIISMVKRASQTPKSHTFQAFPAKGDKTPDSGLATVITKLWQSGISLSHWSFLPAGNHHGCKQIWLPPYQFEKTSQWLPNIDRAMEIHNRLLSSAKQEESESEPILSPKLVTRDDSLGGNSSSLAYFAIDTDCQRFREVVSGHAVRQRPLCPASMYMECVTMATQILLGEFGETNLVFEELAFHAPLGLDPTRKVVICIEQRAQKCSWKFIIQSFLRTESRARSTTHSTGAITVAVDPKLECFERLLQQSMDRFRKRTDVEKLMSKRAYGLFEPVVSYGQFFQAISHITLGENEALAAVKLQQNQPHREESTAWRSCESVTIDAFIQVVGLLLNTSSMVSGNEVFVAIGAQSATILKTCTMDGSTSWQVYANFAMIEDSHAIADIFVSSAEGHLVAMLHDCRFSRLPISKFEKLLDAANLEPFSEAPDKLKQDPYVISNVTAGPCYTPTVDSLQDDVAEASSLHPVDESALRELIASYTGLSPREIPHGAALAELGVDSLASVNLVVELQAKFDLHINSDEVVISSLATLLQHQQARKIVPVVDKNNRVTKEQLPTLRPDGIPPAGPQEQESNHYHRLKEILVNTMGIRIEEIKESCTLASLGVDSLSAVEMKQEIEDSFSVQFDSDQPALEMSVRDLMQSINLLTKKKDDTKAGSETAQGDSAPPTSDYGRQRTNSILPDPFKALTQSNAKFESVANGRGFLRYWSDVAPAQGELLLAYIIESFGNLGIDLGAIRNGALIPSIPYLPKYEKLVQRLWEILESHNIVLRTTDAIVRGSGPANLKSSSQILDEFRTQHPRYNTEADLMALTGPRLAECLKGSVDPLSLVFGTSTSRIVLENFYSQSPMMSTLTEQLVHFLLSLLRDAHSRDIEPVRILEVGAGTGGTTRRLVEALKAADIAVQYTFTDISISLVSKAKTKFREYGWMDFSTFNLEDEVSDSFRHRFDIVISANCVHATRDRKASCRRLRETLMKRGLLVLSEVTRVIDWYDICFGLLDGWWIAEGSSTYPLQPASSWVSTFRAAGFSSVGFSQGPIPEANTQQLLVGCAGESNDMMPTSMSSITGQEYRTRIETMIYKEVSGVQIQADVFLPRDIQDSRIPIGMRPLSAAFASLGH